MNVLPRRCAVLMALPLALLPTGCGGGGGPAPLPPPTAKFSDASMSGQYAFSMSGSELCAGVSSYFTRVGSFLADGKGKITSGLEDINVCAGVETLQFNGGKYSIGADGRGSLELTNSTGTTTYSIALSTTAGGSIAQHGGFVAVLVTCLAITAAWLAVAWNMSDFVPAPSPASRT